MQFVLRALTVVAGLSSFVIILLVLAVAHQLIATAGERRQYPAPGTLVDVGGYRIHWRCSGNGNPTVILESGFGMTSNEWVLVQPEISRFTRACSYDRNGYGWSDRGPDKDPVDILRACCERVMYRGLT